MHDSCHAKLNVSELGNDFSLAALSFGWNRDESAPQCVRDAEAKR